MTPLYLVGAGGFGRELSAWVRRAAPDGVRLAGFVDDRAEPGTHIDEIPVAGTVDWLRTQSGAAALLAVGSPASRRALHQRLADAPLQWPSLVDPSALIGPRTTLGAGSIVCPGAILTVDVELGPFALVNLHVSIGHDARVGAYAALSPGVRMSGFSRVGDGVDAGTGAILVPGVHVGDRTILGAGTVVTRDLPADVLAVGAPARVVRSLRPAD